MTKKTYAGIPEKYSRLDDAKVVLIPVPYDGTSTWQKGADKGPEAFLDASENMELFDIETRSEPYKKGVYLAPAITENSSPEKMVETVHKITKNYINQDKFVTILVENILYQLVLLEHLMNVLKISRYYKLTHMLIYVLSFMVQSVIMHVLYTKQVKQPI